ncbi:hypothetical protein LUZ60_014812 [Juncus effusus]|nr:hypothetical protein LUZ60_014812 [Juncus effusus]
MLVRTYGRRRGAGAGASSSSDLDSDCEELELPSSSPLLLQNFSQSQESANPKLLSYLSQFSSQDSSPWSLDPESASRLETASLMEAQELGEMMAHTDEVDFAIDGLRPGKPVRIRRASLVSLLNVCATPRQRQLLRAHGLSQRIIDALLSLNFDDPPCTIAASALFYLLASDVHDDHLLDSPSCIKFLLKLINPPKNSSDAKGPSVGSKLIGLSRIKLATNSSKGESDSSSREIMSKVEEVLLNCKEIKPINGDFEGLEKRPELSSKWIALLTMEKACISAVSLEETTDTMRRIGSSFKERLRELGGLDAIFSVLTNCHSTLEKCKKDNSLSVAPLKDVSILQSVLLLMKCFKIMENATFLSKDNQECLLKMSKGFSSEGSNRSFVGVVLSVIKHLSDLSLIECTYPLDSKEPKSSEIHAKENHRGSNGAASSSLTNYNSEQHKESKSKETAKFPSEKYKKCSSQSKISLAGCPSSISCNGPLGRSFGDRFKKVKSNAGPTKPNSNSNKISDSIKSLSIGRNPGGVLHKRPRVSDENKSSIEVFDQFEFDEDDVGNSGADSQKSSQELRKRSRVSGNTKTTPRICEKNAKSSGAFLEKSSKEIVEVIDLDGDDLETSKACSQKNPSKKLCKRPPKVSRNSERESGIDELDPFEFDANCSEPSKWDLLNLKEEQYQRDRKNMRVEFDLAIITTNGSSQSVNESSQSQSQSMSQPSAVEDSNLLEDCLLAAVKVLMNLTNDNPTGCQQIGGCGGLDIMASLIIKHFPMFDDSNAQAKENNNRQLRDHELDLLVAILGLLVNLVEKDSRNRLRLASARVSVSLGGKNERQEAKRDLIPLFCSIFMTNQSSGDPSEEKEIVALDNEDYLLQGEKEAEKMIVEAYSALLLAFLSTESMDVREAIASCLPNNNLKSLVPVLERFVAFHLSLNMISPETHSVVTKVIESCKRP